MTATALKPIAATNSDVWCPDGGFRSETLPGWTYHSAEFFALEKEHLFLTSWQLVCHVSEVVTPGDFATLTLLGERALVVRGEDGTLRAFYNVCRHRAAAVATGDSGRCDGHLRCPYHGWVYGLDGHLKAVPGQQSFPEMDKAEYGLTPLALEVFQGFVFVNFGGNRGPSVADRMTPYTQELQPYRLEEMEPFDSNYGHDIEVDWKNVMDNFLEGYHVPVGHPGLYRLFGTRYEAEAAPNGVSRAIHWLRDKPSENWSERHYQTLLPELDHLPEDRRRAWAYYILLPNVAIDVYCDHVDVFHVIPVAPGKCRYRGRSYRLPNPSRPLKAAQYLNRRINTQVQREDEELVASVQEGLASRSYVSGILSEKEICLRQFHHLVREALPVSRLPRAPERGTMAQANAALAAVMN
jgi:phenylpropionate dioxygenase-like ring-hydroxylating dioxygenase large terminal subunit